MFYPSCRMPFLVTGTLLVALQLTQTAAAQDTSDPQIQIAREVDYLGAGRAEKLDLYLPEQDGPARPAVLIVHGGGWKGGDKAAKRELNFGNTLAEAGYVCASINYVLAEDAELLSDRLRQVWPQNLHDCKTAVRFLRKHAVKYNIDPNRIGAIGGSAGGHLVAMLATTAAEDGLDPSGPYGDYSCRIQAVIPMYGVHDLLQVAGDKDQIKALTPADREMLKLASPVVYVSADDPPALILHGTNDALVPVKQSQILFDALVESKVQASLHVIGGAPHTFDLQPKQGDLRPLVIQFLNEHL